MLHGCRVQLKSALFFSPNCPYGFPVGLSFFLRMSCVSGRDSKEVMVSWRVMVANKGLVTQGFIVVNARVCWRNGLTPPGFIRHIGGSDVDLLFIVQLVGHSVSSFPDDGPSILKLLVFLISDIVNQRLHEIGRGRMGLQCVQ